MSSLKLPASAKPPDQVPLHFALLLFPAFQALDVFGPLDALNTLSFIYPSLRLSILSHDLSPVSTLPDSSIFPPKPPSPNNDNNNNGGVITFEQRILPTHTYTSPPSDIDVLIIPGGVGSRAQFHSSWHPLVDFVSSYTSNPTTTANLKAIFTVCTGSILLARAIGPRGSGFLDGVNATTNKSGFQRAKDECPAVRWAPRARWVKDSMVLPVEKEVKVWTCSGVSAGLDGIFAFIGEEYGEEVADSVAKVLEYDRIKDPNNDPFAVDSN